MPFPLSGRCHLRRKREAKVDLRQTAPDSAAGLLVWRKAYSAGKLPAGPTSLAACHLASLEN